ncbi:hypothetical protein BT93_H1540 [Corymbia citriodora subsp. variegata]|nr:hypothetical protein BT93_H1540 [Corymbia citriodora subsp. variegata]
MVYKGSPKPKSNASKLKGFRDGAFASLGNLIKLLPTGMFFMLQFLNPVLTNNGHCHHPSLFLTRLFINVCGLSCAFSCFTDSYTGSDGAVHYGIATLNGLWPSPASETVDLSNFKLRVGDFVHALLSTVVFVAMALVDPNTVTCLYSSTYTKEHMVLLKTLPAVIGAISSAVFMVFPSKRHGIGYPSSSDGCDC